jgi:ATP-dependent Clp protease ATP-binding subunit ClpA
VELPLSAEARQVLLYAAEESNGLGDSHIGTEHLMLGLLRQKGSVAEKILHENGLGFTDVRQQIVNGRGST